MRARFLVQLKDHAPVWPVGFDYAYLTGRKVEVMTNEGKSVQVDERAGAYSMITYEKHGTAVVEIDSTSAKLDILAATPGWAFLQDMDGVSARRRNATRIKALLKSGTRPAAVADAVDVGTDPKAADSLAAVHDTTKEQYRGGGAGSAAPEVVVPEPLPEDKWEGEPGEFYLG